jgi:nitrogen PTS system EIIA component
MGCPSLVRRICPSMYLNLIQVAESFGVSEGVVEGWARHDGLPFTPDRSRLLFDGAQVAQWAATRGLATKAGFLARDQAERAARQKLGPLVRAGKIWRDVSSVDVPVVFERVVSSMKMVTPPILGLLGRRVREKGGVTMAPVGMGFALPHPRERLALGRDSGTIALLFLNDALKLDEPAVDDFPVRKLFFFISPSPRAHFDILASLSRGLRGGVLRTPVDDCAPDEKIFGAFDAMDKAAEEVK